jgi:hypothetical protein
MKKGIGMVFSGWSESAGQQFGRTRKRERAGRIGKAGRSKAGWRLTGFSSVFMVYREYAPLPFLL